MFADWMEAGPAMKKRLWLGCVGAGSVTALALIVALWPSGAGINHWTYQRIRSGMSKDEVVELLGAEPTYGPGELKDSSPVFTIKGWQLQTKAHIWESGERRIYVIFDEEGKACLTGHRNLGEEPFVWRASEWLGFR
jgi:hypothetical protein